MKKLYALIFVLGIFGKQGLSQVSFTPDQSFACLPAAINFTNTSSAGVNFVWDFGDGYGTSTTGTAAVASHTYTTSGNFNVSLQAYDVSWNYVGYYNTNVSVEGMPSKLATIDSTVCPGDITNADIGNSYSDDITWDFGDGVVLSNVSYNGVEHIYSSVGTYIITATAVFPTCGTYNATRTIYVGNSYPIGGTYPLYIQSSVDTICPGDEVDFNIPYQYENYYINYGDGVTENSTYKHSYQAAGNFVVKVTLVNGCNNTLDLFDTMAVRNNLPVNINPGAEFSYDTTCINTNVQLYPPLSGYSGYLWNFGGGHTSASENAMISYPLPGNYSVGLTITNGCGNSATMYDTVVISNNLPVNNLSFDGFSGTDFCPNDGFYMSVEVDGSWDQYDFLWDFGDGNTATAPNVSHSYANVGAYTVSLTATNFCGSSSTISQVMNVGSNVIPDPQNYFAGVPNDGTLFCPGDSVLFVFGPGSLGADVYWDFGDGNNGNATTVLSLFGANYNIIKHAYSSLGTYNVTMTYTNSCGNSFNNSFPIIIANGVQPEADMFEDYIEYNCQGQPMSFYAIGGINYVWDFGDQSGNLITHGTVVPVEHTYEDAGSYLVSVEVTNGCGLSTTKSQMVVIPESKINITTNTINSSCGDADGKAIAVVSGGVAPYQYQWSNGDMTFIADSIPAGIYVVNVEDKNGCKNFAIATLSDDQAATILTAAIVNPSCYGDNSGAIDISVIGNSSPFSYVWSNGSTNQDVNQLQAGPHEVIVTDANGCIATKSILVESPGKVTVTAIGENASCGGNDGQAAVAVSGSSAPYNYLWSNGATGSVITGISAGIYDVVVIDANGCVIENSVAVSEGNINIILDSLTGTGCTGDPAAIYIRVLPNGTYTYSWSNGQTSEDVANLGTGQYSVEVTDSNNGCVGFAQYSILDLATTENDICIVTVDSISNTNRVVWEKDPNATNISHYNIYKESSQSGVYYLVDQVPYDSLSNWRDPISNPQVRSWRYKLSVVDDCGNESTISSEHKTIHLTVNQGINNSYNLIWDHYDGLTYSTYEIYRKTSSTGWQLVTTLPSNLNSYTDVSPPAGTEYYRVEALTSANCEPTRAGVNTSRSNVKNTPSAPVFGLSVLETDLENLTLYPNPTNSTFTIEFNNSELYKVSVYNSIGELITFSTVINKFSYDLAGHSNGIYFIRIENNKQQKILKAIKN